MQESSVVSLSLVCPERRERTTGQELEQDTGIAPHPPGIGPRGRSEGSDTYHTDFFIFVFTQVEESVDSCVLEVFKLGEEFVDEGAEEGLGFVGCGGGGGQGDEDGVEFSALRGCQWEWREGQRGVRRLWQSWERWQRRAVVWRRATLRLAWCDDGDERVDNSEMKNKNVENRDDGDGLLGSDNKHCDGGNDTIDTKLQTIIYMHTSLVHNHSSLSPSTPTTRASRSTPASQRFTSPSSTPPSSSTSSPTPLATTTLDLWMSDLPLLDVVESARWTT